MTKLQTLFIATGYVVQAVLGTGDGTWEALSPIPFLPRQEHTVVAINSTAFAVLGGIRQNPRDGRQFNNTGLVTIYNAATDSWVPAAELPLPLNHPNAAAVGGKIYLLGGLAERGDGAWHAVGDSWAYDPAADAWAPLPPLPVGTERGSAAVGVRGATVYLAGGLRRLELWAGGRHETVGDVSAFDTAAGRWRVLGGAPLPEPRDHAAAAVVGGRLYVTGGRRLLAGLTVTDAVYSLDLSRAEEVVEGEGREGKEEEEDGLRWRLEPARLPTARGGHMAAAVGGVIYTFGGEGNAASESGVFDQVEAFDVSSGVWTQLAPMPVPRHGSVAVALDGRIYIAGGGLAQGPGATNATDVFTP